MSRTHVLEALKCNKRLLILVASVERYVAELPRATLKPHVRKPRDIGFAPPKVGYPFTDKMQIHSCWPCAPSTNAT